MILHSPIISGSLSFADGGTFTLPDNGIYSGSFSGSINGIGDPSTFSASIASDFSGLSTDYNDLQNIPIGIVSSSAQIDTLFNLDGVISGSEQVQFNDVTNNPFSASAGSVTVSKSIIPTTSTITLGTQANPFQDLYLSSASLYIDGTQVISSNTNELIITTDVNQSLKLVETGVDTVQIQTQNGDITFTSTGTGNIELDAPVQIVAGNKVLSSDGNAIVFGEDIDVEGNITLSGTVDGVDVAGLKSDFDTFSQQTIVSGSSQIEAAGISNISQTIKTKLDQEGVISGSSQVQAGSITGDIALGTQTSGNYVATLGTGTGVTIGSNTGEGSTPTIAVNYGSTANTAVEGNTSVSFAGTANEITVDGGSSITLGSGGTVTYGLADTIGGNRTFSGNVTVSGNLTVSGTTTSVNSTTVAIGDNIIELNGTGAANGGLYVKDVTAPNTATGSLLWDTTNDLWKAGVKDSEVELVTISGTQTLTNKTINGSQLVDGSVSNAKLANSSVTVTAGSGLTTGGSVSLGGSVTLAHADTSTQASSNNSGRTYIQDITLDTYGHVTGLATATETVTDTTYSAGTGLSLTGTTFANTGVLSNVAGTGISVSGATGNVTITATDVYNRFQTIAVSGQSNVVADSTSDTLTLAAGTNVSITTNATTDTITINSTDQYTGTVTSVATGNGLTGGTITSSGTLSMSGTYTGDFAVTGNITATADVVAYSSSDKRLKDNVQNIENPIEKVQQLNGVTWDWNENADEVQKSLPNVGVIAQEVEQVLPQLVKDRENGFKGVDYAKLTGLLIEAIKEQQKQIDELKSKLG